MTLATNSEGRAANGAIQAALGVLGERSPAAQFASLLYGDSLPDGLAGASPAWLAANAEAALGFIAEKPRPGHKARVRRAENGGASGSIVEIVNDDMPFLVDSVLAELQARGLAVRQLLHPTFKTQRDAAGRLIAIVGPGDRNWNDGRQESYIALHLADRLPERDAAGLIGTLSAILDEVRAAVGDWQPMLRLVRTTADRLEASTAPLAAREHSEALAFLRWLEAGNFTFLGAREYRFSGDGGTGELEPVAASGLGVLRDPAVELLSRAGGLDGTTPLMVSKSGVQSRVHRRVTMDCIRIAMPGPDGIASGEVRLAGLFTSQAYTSSPRTIPLLRQKVDAVMALSGYPAQSHDGKALLNVLETFPRDALFQIDAAELHRWSEGILDLEIRPRVRVLAHVDRYDRFVTALVYMPRDRYTSDVRQSVAAMLEEAYGGRVNAFYPYFTDAPLVRVEFIVARGDDTTPDVDTAEIEQRISDRIRTWDERLAAALAERGDEGERLFEKYRGAFSNGYMVSAPIGRALDDINRAEQLGPELPAAIDFYRDPDMPQGRLRAVIYRHDQPISLSQRVPVLESLGLRAIDERTYTVSPEVTDARRSITLHDMLLETVDGAPLDLGIHAQRLKACFLAIFRGEAESDNFNRLVVAAGADWRSVAALRALAAYLRQLGSPFGPRYIADTLTRHAGITRDLLELFHLRFDSDRPLDTSARQAAEIPVRSRIEGALTAVPSLDEDRILRTILNLIGAMVRTNFYQRGQTPDGDVVSEPGRSSPGADPVIASTTLAFKFDSNAVDAAPRPRPFREIWVYSPRVEGIHLRFAPIARGGIRWSDRVQDFRTEILGLVRAQLVKNAVIVPSGAKGGFLPKLLPRNGTRDAVQKEGEAAYRIFISALLDLTDNIVDGTVSPPPRVVRHDADDPYLVVAADKGTATFSDIANGISRAHGFWLGDAFASGGSDGYDHKRMGITARGAWESVKRHFREMNVDVQRQPFTVVGVGDMSGDVFGNGMLLSQQTRLIGAFDHRDIFIDPNPDPAVSYAERKRLFALPRSSWQDYDKARISRGGGVFSRSAKAIALSDEMKAMLGVDAASLTPVELILSLLKCRTDLLWLGGIGTYVRASAERDPDVGDRANDAVRVAAAELNAKVVGEGANLGVTQRGRIEFAQRGGRINTDSIDNSAGVNTSDQEVNIKIALQPSVRSRALDMQSRHALLAEMTNDVAAASLRNNYQQTLALSLAERGGVRDLPDYALLMHDLEARGLLERALEALPSDMALQERARTGRGLTRPELATLLSYAKIALQHDLLESRVPDAPQLETWLTGYFPPLLRERFGADIGAHSLRREIVALGLTNTVVNRGGPALAARLAAESGRPTWEVALAVMAVRDIFDLPSLWQHIDALDGKIGGEIQLQLYEATQDLMTRLARWLLRNSAAVGDLGGAIVRHKVALAEFKAVLENVLPPALRATIADEAARLAAQGVPAALAVGIARLKVLAHAPAVTEIARSEGRPLAETARAYLQVGERLGIDDLTARGAAIATSDRYDRLAIAQALDRLADAQASFTREALKTGGLDKWLAIQGGRLGGIQRALGDLAGASPLTLSRLLVAAGQLGDLAAGAALIPPAA